MTKFSCLKSDSVRGRSNGGRRGESCCSNWFSEGWYFALCFISVSRSRNLKIHFLTNVKEWLSERLRFLVSSFSRSLSKSRYKSCHPFANHQNKPTRHFCELWLCFEEKMWLAATLPWYTRVLSLLIEMSGYQSKTRNQAKKVF